MIPPWKKGDLVTEQSGAIWRGWVQQGLSELTAQGWIKPTCTATGDTWTDWNRERFTVSTSITTGTSTVATHWQNWNLDWHNRWAEQQQYQQQPAPRIVPPVRTAEEIAAQQQRMAAEAAAYRIEQERLQVIKNVAEERARKLLVQCLTIQQRASLEKHGYFDIHVESINKTFRIKKGWSHNVFELTPDGREKQSLCAHPSEKVPDYDNMLAQKLWLETNPGTFLGVANKGRILIN